MQTNTIHITNDGSNTLFSETFGETYHSIFGAKAESEHIFIQSELRKWTEQQESETNKPIRILEFGFGTGLNAFLTAKQTNQKIEYVTIEKFPIEKDIWSNLNFCEQSTDNKTLFRKLHKAKWGEKTTITPTFFIEKHQCDFLNFNFLPNNFDIVYFDAFSPEKQPELWTEDLFQKIFVSMKKNGILTTYCAKGIVRRTMQKVGFKVERIPGPIGGKREILRAKKQPIKQ